MLAGFRSVLYITLLEGYNSTENVHVSIKVYCYGKFYSFRIIVMVKNVVFFFKEYVLKVVYVAFCKIEYLHVIFINTIFITKQLCTMHALYKV